MAQSLLLPPEIVRGMTTLNKSKFKKQIHVPVLKIGETSMSYIIAVLKPYLLKLEKFKPVQEDQTNLKEKLIFLDPNKILDFDSLGHVAKTALTENGISELNLQHRAITLTFDNWKCHVIISAILPPPLSFSGFSTIGTIIHLNLKDQLLPYKHVIGQVLLEKMKNCKSVVYKLKNIDSSFRNFEMQVLAGSDDLQTEVKENGCRFLLNFADVYWNPRLHDEHAQIVRKLSNGNVLYDVFCGIGPFAIPAARTGCEVLANDLNPECCKWLRRNMVLNKVAVERLRVFNKSGDIFIKQEVREDLLKRVTDTKFKTSRFHVTMNLPATAHTFLSSFVGMFDDNEMSMFTDAQLPIVHLYCFMKNKDDPEMEAVKLVEEVLSVRLPRTTEVCNVRNVAPNKEMIRVSFTLSRNVLLGPKQNVKRTHDESNLVKVKELKINDMDWDGNDAKNATDDLLVLKKQKMA